MSTTIDTDAIVSRLRPSRRTLLYGGLLLNTELVLVALYLLIQDATLTEPRYAVYGLLWINVGAWVIVRTRVAPASDGAKRRAALIAVGYFAALAVAGGLVRPAAAMSMSVAGGAGAGASASSVRVLALPPGWGPALLYRGDLLRVFLMPAHVVGYAALAYLVYATAVDLSGAAVSGLLGLLSCVSCSWPIVASVAASVFGGGSAVAAATGTLSYDLSTAVFLVTVGLLYWRPFASGRGG